MPSNKEKTLVCQLDARAENVKSEGVTLTHSAVSCLNEATMKAYGLIILCFSTRSIRARSEIFELCNRLKHNSLTCKAPIFALIDRWHRAVVWRLKEAGLDFIDVRQSPNRIDSEYISNCILNTAVSNQIDQVMLRLCPFLNYKPLNGRSELITCGAWRDRMVLGGKRLHEVCESENHLYCEYFQNPRPKK